MLRSGLGQHIEELAYRSRCIDPINAFRGPVPQAMVISRLGLKLLIATPPADDARLRHRPWATANSVPEESEIFWRGLGTRGGGLIHWVASQIPIGSTSSGIPAGVRMISSCRHTRAPL